MTNDILQLPAEATSDSKKKDKPTIDYTQYAVQFLRESDIGDTVFYRGQLYRYDRCRYVEENNLPEKMRRFFISKKVKVSNQLIGNTGPIVEAICFQDPAKFQSMPFYLGNDSFPVPSNIIAYRNGLLDVSEYLKGNNTLIPHSPAWFSTVCLPHDFTPEADCPRWKQFLSDVFEGDEARISLLREWFGYCLTSDISQQKLLVKIGPPRAGKGTTDRVLQALIGDENSTGYSLHSLTDRFGLHRLVGKLVCFVGEVNLVQSKEKYRILEKLNSIVGGDFIDTEEKYEAKVQSQQLTTRFNISCNEMPQFVDESGALAARLLILNFDRSFVGNENRNLSNELLSEIEGINNWALEGYRQLKTNGRFSETATGNKLINEFRRDNGDAFAFLQDCIVVQKSIDPGNLSGVRTADEPLSIDGDRLQILYCKWCEDNSRQFNPKWFARKLRVILPKLTDERAMSNGVRRRIYHGIAPLPN